MEKAKISAGQFMILIILFDMGTAIIRVLATQAANDAWLAILLGMLGGLLIFHVYVALYRLYPDLSLTGYARAIVGNRIGWFLGVLYILFFIHGAARDLREGADLLISTSLDLTPGTIVSSVMILAVGYVLIRGIEVLARTAQIFFAILAITALVSNVLIFLSGIVEFDRLLPVLGNGWKPVIDITLKQTIEFPYEELICFTMLLPYVHSKKRGIQLGFVAVLISGVILSYSSATQT